MAGGVVGVELHSAAVGLKGRRDVAAAAQHQTQVVPTQRHFRGPLGGGLGQGNGFIEFALLHQPGRQVEACPEADPGIEGNLQSLPVTGHGTD